MQRSIKCVTLLNSRPISFCSWPKAIGLNNLMQLSYAKVKNKLMSHDGDIQVFALGKFFF